MKKDKHGRRLSIRLTEKEYSIVRTFSDYHRQTISEVIRKYIQTLINI